MTGADTMKKNRRFLEKVIESQVGPMGFVKQRSVWVLTTEDGYLGVQIQGSRFAKGLVYINFMGWYRAISRSDLETFPDHIHFSFRGHTNEARDAVCALLTLDDSDVEFEAFVEAFKSLFFSRGLAELMGLQTLEAALAAVRRDELEGIFLALHDAAKAH
ncbi:hypothetical protein DES44_2574 [Roseateles depolymerans]|uniref:Uncharacterized protein n=2 Tax=Roseateles depolymerans TaxID=76731 RepID=A0A0U3MEG2_9BURK|nr:hypothetical protein RD2015_2620 [Roseateles depolymerans]REG20068.1 hypothetical protein DES44_2574 [Roseateles depolymerans]